MTALNPGSQTFTVTLQRPQATEPWGFRLQGGKDFKTPISVQTVTPGGVAHRCGLEAADAVLQVCGVNSDELEHMEAKRLIQQAGNSVTMLVQRGAVRVWKPTVTQIKPGEQAAGDYGDADGPFVQRTSLASSRDQPPPVRVGSAHNRTARPFPGASSTPSAPSFQSSISAPKSQSYPVTQAAPFAPPNIQPARNTSHLPSNVTSYATATPTQHTPPHPQDSTYSPAQTTYRSNPPPSAAQPRSDPPTRGQGALYSSDDVTVGRQQPPAEESNAEGGAAIVHAQFNSPMGLYSQKNAASTLAAQSSILSRNINKMRLENSGAPLATASYTAAPTKSRVWTPQPAKPPPQEKPASTNPAEESGKHVNDESCDVCGQTGSNIRALGKIYCKEHFRCFSCKEQLFNQKFRGDDSNHLYCEKDFARQCAPRCHGCAQPIVGDVVQAIGKKYHPTCLVCSQCQLPISGTFHMEAGKAYCHDDWSQMFKREVCADCGYTIDPGDLFLEACDGHWHRECFNCTRCRANLENCGFHVVDNKPFCELH